MGTSRFFENEIVNTKNISKCSGGKMSLIIRNIQFIEKVFSPNRFF